MPAKWLSGLLTPSENPSPRPANLEHKVRRDIPLGLVFQDLHNYLFIFHVVGLEAETFRDQRLWRAADLWEPVQRDPVHSVTQLSAIKNKHLARSRDDGQCK
jgi:hypothetical protein